MDHKAEAIANADAQLNNVGLPTYSELLAQLSNAVSFMHEAVAAGILDGAEVEQQFEAARAALVAAEPQQ